MKILRVFLAVSALFCLGGWVWLHKPYSPSDDLPGVLYTAYELENPAGGNELAGTARAWKGITAVSFNPISSLIVLSHHADIPVENLRERLQSNTSGRVQLKIFPEYAGPKCPVPQEALAALPVFLLKTGIAASLAFLLLFFWPRVINRQLSI